jgi:hypothetical protein
VKYNPKSKQWEAAVVVLRSNGGHETATGDTEAIATAKMIPKLAQRREKNKTKNR